MRLSVAGTITLLLLAAGAPLYAQDRDTQITAFASQVEIQGDNELEGGFTTEFDDSIGMGLSVHRFVARMISVEAAIFNIRNDVSLMAGNAPIDLGDVSLTPVSIGAQLHLAGRSRIDPYIGAGGAYVIAGDLFSPDLEAAGLGRLELESKPTWYVNAGIGIQVSQGFGIVLEGRQLQYETSSRSTTTGVEQELDLTPRLLSLGLRFRF